jgi:hypothetical protein
MRAIAEQQIAVETNVNQNTALMCGDAGPARTSIA